MVMSIHTMDRLLKCSLRGRWLSSACKRRCNGYVWKHFPRAAYIVSRYRARLRLLKTPNMLPLHGSSSTSNASLTADPVLSLRSFPSAINILQRCLQYSWRHEHESYSRISFGSTLFSCFDPIDFHWLHIHAQAILSDLWCSIRRATKHSLSQLSFFEWCDDIDTMACNGNRKRVLGIAKVHPVCVLVMLMRGNG